MILKELDVGVDMTGDKNDYTNEYYMPTMFIWSIVTYINNG